jgi:hypothetical protein
MLTVEDVQRIERLIVPGAASGHKWVWRGRIDDRTRRPVFTTGAGQVIDVRQLLEVDGHTGCRYLRCMSRRHGACRRLTVPPRRPARLDKVRHGGRRR